MAASGLATLAQSDVASGMWRAVARHLIPENGAYDLVNALLDEDGSPYRRGGAAYLSTAAFGTSLRFLWDGFLTPGARTVFANPDDFGALDAASAPVNLGGTGLAGPKRAVELAGTLFIGGGTLYGGSRMTGPYSTGTVSVTNGLKTVTGSGTTWNTLTDAGMLLRIGGADRYYPVASIDSPTTLTLRDNYAGVTGSGATYELAVLGSAATAPYRSTDIYFTAGDRLFAAIGDKAYFTAADDPHSWTVTDFHQIAGGVDIVGGVGIGDRALVFATNGLWMISGLAFDLTDAAGNTQHRVQHASPDLILLSHEGLTAYRGGVVAPCADGIWLVDGVSTPELLTKSISGLWRNYVGQGWKTGLTTVFRSHLFVPILDGGNAVRDMLVCRLDRPTKSPVGTIYPWTRLEGYGAEMAALAIRTGGIASARNPQLLGASTRASARVADLTPFFGPELEHKQDPDGTVHAFTIDTRDYATGNGRSINMVRKVKVRYELRDAATDNPTLAGYYGLGDVIQTDAGVWDESLWDTGIWGGASEDEWIAMAGLAPEDDGRDSFPWKVNKRARFIRFRFRSTDPNIKLLMRTVELFVRQSRKA